MTATWQQESRKTASEMAVFYTGYVTLPRVALSLAKQRKKRRETKWGINFYPFFSGTKYLDQLA